MSDAKGKDASGNFDPDEPGSAPHQAEDVNPVGEEVTIYPADGKLEETAQALLAAADDPRDVKFSDGVFIVPEAVAKAAKIPEAGKSGPALTQSRQDANVSPQTKPAAKKAAAPAEPKGDDGAPPAAKKAPAKKAAAKKAPAKAAASKPSE